MGNHSAIIHDGNLQPLLRKAGEGSFGSNSIPSFLSGWISALDVLRQRTFAGIKQPGDKFKFDFEGVLPAPEFADLGSNVRARLIS